eukprot:3865659-Pyramimonas_sp.AAC.1
MALGTSTPRDGEEGDGRDGEGEASLPLAQTLNADVVMLTARLCKFAGRLHEARVRFDAVPPSTLQLLFASADPEHRMALANDVRLAVDAAVALYEASVQAGRDAETLSEVPLRARMAIHCFGSAAYEAGDQVLTNAWELGQSVLRLVRRHLSEAVAQVVIGGGDGPGDGTTLNDFLSAQTVVGTRDKARVGCSASSPPIRLSLSSALAWAGPRPD